MPDELFCDTLDAASSESAQRQAIFGSNSPCSPPHLNANERLYCRTSTESLPSPLFPAQLARELPKQKQRRLIRCQSASLRRDGDIACENRCRGRQIQRRPLGLSDRHLRALYFWLWLEDLDFCFLAISLSHLWLDRGGQPTWLHSQNLLPAATSQEYMHISDSEVTRRSRSRTSLPESDEAARINPSQFIYQIQQVPNNRNSDVIRLNNLHLATQSAQHVSSPSRVHHRRICMPHFFYLSPRVSIVSNLAESKHPSSITRYAIHPADHFHIVT